MLSIGITILLGTDSIQLAETLWTNVELRAIAAAQADAVVAEGGANADLSDLLDDLVNFPQDWLVANTGIPKNTRRGGMGFVHFLEGVGTGHHCRGCLTGIILLV